MGRHYVAANVNQWVEFARRARLKRTVKAVALMMATYARHDGTQIYPGIATLAIACELSYRVTLDAVSELERLGLVERVAGHGRAVGRYDSYRLTLAEDVLDCVDVLSPQEFKDLAAEMRSKYRGKHRNACDPDARVEPVDNLLTHALPSHAFVGRAEVKRVLFDDTQTAERMLSESDKRVLFHAGVSSNENLPALTTNLHSSDLLRTGLEVVGGPEPELICDLPGCAKGWIVDGDALTRCPRCNALDGVA